MKKGKLTQLILVSLVLMLVAAGCASNKENSNASNASNAPSNSQASGEKSVSDITVGISYTALSDEFTVRLANSFEARAKELGYKVVRTDAQMNNEKQVGQIENFIAQKVDAIVFSPVSVDGAAPAVQAAVDAGIPIITFTVKSSNQDQATSFVGTDLVQSGQMQGEMVVEDLQGKGNIAAILGQMGHDGQIGRSEGLKKALEGTEIEIVAEQTANWKREDAVSIMENWLSANKQIDAVVAQSDAMALGALMAIKERGLEGKIKVYGIDAQEDALDALEEGTMAGTILQNAEAIAYKAAEVALEAAQGKSVDKSYEVPYEKIRVEDVPNYRK